jgi:putative phosphoesterase
MTRVGLISDIHVDLNRIKGEDLVTGLLARESARRNLDILLIAGDISSDYLLTLRTLAALEEQSGARVLFVPGNHDIWNEFHPETKAWDTYNALLEHPGNLARGPVLLDEGWAIAGDLGWYDYHYGDPSFSFEDFDRMRFGERTWQDKIKSIWDRGTLDMHRLFVQRLESGLRPLAAEGRKILLATHVVQVPEFTVSPPGPMWKYFNAFLGSPEYGEIAQRYGAEVSVCGHVHYRRRLRKGQSLFVCPCLGYVAEWPAPPDPEKEIAETLQVFELGGKGATLVPWVT